MFNNYLSWGVEESPCYLIFSSFHAAPTPTVANFKLPTWWQWIQNWEKMLSVGSWMLVHPSSYNDWLYNWINCPEWSIEREIGNVWDMKDNMRKSNICLIVILEVIKRMTKIFQNWCKSWILRSRRTTDNMQIPIVMKLPNTQDKETILKASREKKRDQLPRIKN